MLVVLLVLLVVLAAVVFFQIKAGSSRMDDWNAAYVELAPWLKSQADRGKVPAEAPGLLTEAWRLSHAEDYTQAQKSWLKLQVTLASPTAGVRCIERAAEDGSAGQRGTALQKLLTPPPGGFTPTDEERAAAVGEFVQRQLVFTVKEAARKSSPLSPSS